jgi:lantibiotic modifying enzyme
MHFSTAWCHGAPGVALSRLRAYEVTSDSRYKMEAITALRTTYRVAQSWLSSQSGDYSLCHGLSGNADILLYGWQVLGAEFKEGLAISHEVAQRRTSNMGSQSIDPRRSGSDFRKPRSLMLGLAGIGWFSLRLYDNSLKSVLTLVT